MWILNQYENELVHFEGDRKILIVDNFDIEVSGKRYDVNRGSFLLGRYDRAGRTKEVFNQLTDWVATGTQGIFRMPRK